MEWFLVLGFLIGMQHALEADHLAAVGAMAMQGKTGKRSMAVRGAMWGLGHTTTLFAICAAVLLLGFVLTEATSAALEFGVGIMLIVLGLDVLRRFWAQKIHFHVHKHEDRGAHFHAHSHATDNQDHSDNPHVHSHPNGLPLRAFVVGLIHGGAGSAALLALAVAATTDPWMAVWYVALFGLGSVVGMAALSFVIAWPLSAAEAHAKWIHRGLAFGSSGLAIFLGISILIETGPIAVGVL